MSLSQSSLRLRLSQSTQDSAVRRALGILDSETLKFSRLNPVCSTARELLIVWKTREETSKLNGFAIPGVSNLNVRLSLLPSNAQVEQYNVDSESSAGSIFIDSATGEFLGDTIVERRAKNRQMLDLEDQLFQSSRKSA